MYVLAHSSLLSVSQWTIILHCFIIIVFLFLVILYIGQKSYIICMVNNLESVACLFTFLKVSFIYFGFF